MSKLHEIGRIQFSDSCMTLEIDGEEKQYNLNDVSPALAKASELERMTYHISPSGYGIHWPLLDEDLSIDGLLEIVHCPPALQAA